MLVYYLMKHWQHWIITLLILALPVAGIAGFTNIHCLSSADLVFDQGEAQSNSHCSNSAFDTIDNSTQPAGCPCDCSQNMDCLSAGINIFTVTSLIKLMTNLASSLRTLDSADQFTSFYPPPVFRPPILFS